RRVKGVKLALVEVAAPTNAQRLGKAERGIAFPARNAARIDAVARGDLLGRQPALALLDGGRPRTTANVAARRRAAAGHFRVDALQFVLLRRDTGGQCQNYRWLAKVIAG